MLRHLPNALTIGRILVIPFVVGLLFIDGSTAAVWATVLFVAAAVTDFFDGWLARKLQVVSEIGRFLDPIADKLLVAAVLLMLAAAQRIWGVHLVAAILILLREVFISGLREFLGGAQIKMPVSQLAKWKTTVQLVALAVLIAAPALPPEDWVNWMAFGLLWLSAILTVVTGWDYFHRGLKVMLERDRARG